MPTTIPSTFLDWLNEQLAMRNLSQAEASRRAGLNQNAISDIMTGKVRSVSLRTARSLARLFNTPFSEVLQLAGHIEQSAGDDLTLKELLELAQALPERDREELLNYARWKQSRRQ